MELKKHIPNAITCGNLVSGCFSILFIASGMPIKAAIMIIVAGLFDFLDGFAARTLNAHSPIGPDLDSLSDVVSFGVAPGLIMSYLMNNALDLPRVTLDGIDLMPCLAFMLPVFAAIRLARFNIDETQQVAFRGLPAPGMAIFVASLPMALAKMGHLSDGALGFWACLGITLLLSFMMVSNLRFFSFKMKSLTWKGNQVRWIFLAIAVVGIAIFKMVALPFVMIIYILMSIFFAGKTVEE
jgi:CDP-diacylglycerol--serine O-phosphatidyltransferase